MASSRARGGARGRSARGSRRSVRSHLVVPLVMLLLFAAIGTGTYVALSRYGDAQRSGTCTASGLGTSRTYSTEQAGNAALITAISVDRGLPPRAASIALATAYQESRLENIAHGDRDSLGLFQQRPSQDWGTAEQIMDPVYATNAFYDALVRIPGYTTMDLNDAAQQVQRSGVPEGYRDHETEGRIWASALSGNSGANLVCDVAAPTSAVDPRAAQRELERQFPRLAAAGSITSALVPARDAVGEVPPGAGPTALVIDVGGNAVLGRAIANWAVTRAADDGVVQVVHDGRLWDRRATDQTPGAWGQTGGDPDPRHVVILVAGG